MRNSVFQCQNAYRLAGLLKTPKKTLPCLSEWIRQEIWKIPSESGLISAVVKVMEAISKDTFRCFITCSEYSWNWMEWISGELPTPIRCQDTSSKPWHSVRPK